MAKPAFSMPDEMLEEIDETIKQLKLREEMDMKASRSEVMRGVIQEWLDEHEEIREGNRTVATSD
jgi:metal-responsive CopG/Arc/MetJ family transcriptional regulator